MARRHLYGYRKTRKAIVVAVADPDAKRRKKAHSRWRIPKAYSDFREMLRQERLDVVSVCAPPVVLILRGNDAVGICVPSDL